MDKLKLENYIKNKIIEFRYNRSQVSGGGARGKWQTIINEFELLLDWIA